MIGRVSILTGIALIAAVAIAVPVPSAKNRSAAFFMANLSALWDEVREIQKEIDFHLHGGQMNQGHDIDNVLGEVDTLTHEHHVHHLKHPHEGHNEHHNEELLEHLETSHGHGDHSHHHGGHGGHGSHGDHSEEGHDSGSNRGRKPMGGVRRNCGGGGGGRRANTAGLQDNCGDRRIRPGQDGHGINPLAHPHAHGSEHHHGGSHEDTDDSHEHGPGHEHGPDHVHGSSHEEDTHDQHGLDLDMNEHSRLDASFFEGDHYQGDANWIHAYCDLKPNSELPGEHVTGRVDISKRGTVVGILYFDVDASGFDIAQDGTVYRVYLHENAIQDDKCDLAGGHYNEPVGNIGDVTVSAEGELDHVISASMDVTFEETLGKSIVITSIQNDARIACCNVKKVYTFLPGVVRKHHH